MSKVHVTAKGTKLPIMALKGKDYMMVAYRIQWFREENPLGTIKTEVVQLGDTHAIFKATISISDKEGRIHELASATKKEDQKGFPDFIEKAETGSIGRALALAGYGTQFSIPELDEGDRLADAPLEGPKEAPKAKPVEAPAAPKAVTAVKSSFKQQNVSDDDGWE